MTALKLSIVISVIAFCFVFVVYLLQDDSISLLNNLGIRNSQRAPAPGFAENQTLHFNFSQTPITITETSFCGYLSIELMGRLGNQISQIASLIGLSMATKRKAVLTESFKGLTTFFPNLTRYVTFTKSQIFDANWQGIAQKTGFCCHFDATLQNRLKCGTNYELGGYFLSWRYFHNYSESVKQAFAFASKYTVK